MRIFRDEIFPSFSALAKHQKESESDFAELSGFRQLKTKQKTRRKRKRRWENASIKFPFQAITFDTVAV